MTATDQLRTVIRDLEAKAKEMELDKKLSTFADQADHYLRVAASRAGEYAAENRERVEATLDKAGAKVDQKTDGKYHSYVGKVRAGVLVGVDWVAEQRESRPTTEAGPSDAGPTSDAGATSAGATASATSSDSTATSTDSTADRARRPLPLGTPPTSCRPARRTRMPGSTSATSRPPSTTRPRGTHRPAVTRAPLRTHPGRGGVPAPRPGHHLDGRGAGPSHTARPYG